MKPRTLSLIRGDAVCANCTHFHQHYVKSTFYENRFTPIHIGHCAFPRLKDRYTTDYCDHFREKEL